MSDKLIRKAEAGGKLDARSVAAIAAAHSTTERLIVPQDVLAEQLASGLSAHRSETRPSVLRQWIDEVWTKGRLDLIERLTAKYVRFHCETGCLETQSELQQRIERIRGSFIEFNATIDAAVESDELAVCRWRLTMGRFGPQPADGAASQRITAVVTTSLQLEASRIQEGWEFWDARAPFRELLHRASCASDS